MRDGPSQLTARCGWAFVALNEQGQVASAYGVPPPWIVDIHGAEVWALVQACMVGMPGLVSYLCDCESVVKSIHERAGKAVAGSKMHARAYQLLFARLDDIGTDAVVWMPAHCKEHDADTSKKGDGTPLTKEDIRGNAEADRLAKKAVEEHRVEETYVERWELLKSKAKQTAMWTAKVTELANNVPEFPYRDSRKRLWSRPGQRRKRSVRGRRP